MAFTRMIFVLVALLAGCARKDPEFKGDFAQQLDAGPVLFGGSSAAGATNQSSGGQNALAVTVIILN